MEKIVDVRWTRILLCIMKIIKLLSLNRILRDAQLRNKIFFKKLGI